MHERDKYGIQTRWCQHHAVGILLPRSDLEVRGGKSRNGKNDIHIFFNVKTRQ